MISLKKAEKIWLKNGNLFQISSGKKEIGDLLIVNGKIEMVGKVDLDEFDGMIVDCKGCVITPGLMDMHVHLREPGREDEETIETGANGAAVGGFTAVCCMPNTEPVIDNQGVVLLIKERASDHLVDVFPIAAVTKGRDGQELTEVGDLVEAGAVAISDDGDPVYNAEVMRRALEYSKMFGIPVIEHAEDKELSHSGVMHEGFVSTSLGLPGIPSISEEIIVARDILLAEFTGGKLHIAHISTEGSVRLIREAKSRGVNVTCEVMTHHFTLTDEAVRKFDTNTKMNPPLRAQADVDALKEGLRDGTIDVIATDHAPHSSEEKEMEFDQAPFGILGLETAVGLTTTMLIDQGILEFKEALEKLIINPRKILGLEIPALNKGKIANLSILHPSEQWKVDKTIFQSKSRNTPFDGWDLHGCPKGVINKGKYYFSKDLLNKSKK